MAASSKAQLLQEIQKQLAKRYALEPRTGRMTVLEAMIYGICHEDATREQASQVMSRFKDQFFDWNEIRVSAVPEIEASLAELPNAAAKAHAVRRFLRQLFSRTYKFDLDALLKKPLKESIKALQDFECSKSPYVLDTAVQLALGGHAIPLDASMRRCLVRLGVAEEGTEDNALRGALERAIPKTRGSEFVDLVSELGHDTCVEGRPDCERCCLLKLCPTGREVVATAKTKATDGGSSVSSKPKASGSRSKSTQAPPAPAPAPSPRPKASTPPGPSSTSRTGTRKTPRSK